MASPAILHPNQLLPRCPLRFRRCDPIEPFGGARLGAPIPSRVPSLSLNTMPQALPMHRQRAVLLLVACMATGVCFLPLGKLPLVWSLQGIVAARKVALALLILMAIAMVLGRRRMGMSLPLRIGSFTITGAIIAFSIFRTVALANRPLPTFADDDPRASAYYRKACDSGVMEACSALGTCYWTGTCGVAKEGTRGLGLFEKACAGGDMPACGQLGVCYEFGGCGLTKSGERAVSFYERACAGGEMSMCNNLGVCYHKGECGLAQSDARAAMLYEKACRGGDSGACHNRELMKN